jgi:LacI family transcriptional regulator
MVQSKSSGVPRSAAGARKRPSRRRVMQAPTGSPRLGARPSAKDVARLAGVSTATVSRAINLPDRVDARTRESVRDAVARLGYVPDGAARALRSRRSQMVGAVVPSVDYALYARTTSALQAALDARGYSLVLAEQHYDLDAEVRVTEQLLGHGVDAFVFVGLDHDPRLFALLDAYGRPYVLTWGVDPMRRHPSVGFDNRAAAFAATQHLIALGHRRFGLLSSHTAGNDRSTERGLGIRAALAQAGLTLDERHARYGAIDLASSRAMMLELLALRDRPTAVVSTNDVFAVGGMLACRERGVRIPEDLSITGIDNTDLGATQTPGLTSVATPIVDIGRAAGEQVIARLEGRPYEAFALLPFELVVRGSTAPPPRPLRGRQSPKR